jgi:hypothetical protein
MGGGKAQEFALKFIEEKGLDLFLKTNVSTHSRDIEEIYKKN